MRNYMKSYFLFCCMICKTMDFLQICIIKFFFKSLLFDMCTDYGMKDISSFIQKLM